MADPTADAPSWLTWVFGGGAGVVALYNAWQFVGAKLKAGTAEARAERQAAVKEAAENDIIKTLREQLAEERRQRSEDVAQLKAQIAECRKEIGELREQLDDALEARVQAMLEATRVREQNAQIETRLAEVGRENTALVLAHGELAGWVIGLDLPEGARLSPIYGKAKIWLEHNRARLSDAA
ncbi:hypothetical protein TSH7_01335 [Azospirillum sp. TSH7]|uniref:demethoxyubiquinone hydroxylase family protein n=1 Tax=unclassified Azospirillum TaxID=2630922 RepID=UPI000D61F47D|nr:MULTISPECIES: demethoxyubiquinone hydroxylase family protein [unclassified Azospirillum]PWC69115.1 hypothetical protein TSH7_01335 [Azospirillum sp. TSH7]PWC71393.1 hypothetical protein TSH20_03740 [Azospirillum sp. TSH20]